MKGVKRVLSVVLVASLGAGNLCLLAGCKADKEAAKDDDSISQDDFVEWLDDNDFEEARNVSAARSSDNVYFVADRDDWEELWADDPDGIDGPPEFLPSDCDEIVIALDDNSTYYFYATYDDEDDALDEFEEFTDLWSNAVSDSYDFTDEEYSLKKHNGSLLLRFAVEEGPSDIYIAYYLMDDVIVAVINMQYFMSSGPYANVKNSIKNFCEAFDLDSPTGIDARELE